MAFDSAASLLFRIGANADDAEENIARFRTLFGTSMSEMKQQFSSFATELTGGEEAINTHWTAMAGIIAGATTAVGASLLEMANKTAEFGEKLELLHQELGLSVESLSGLQYAATEMGVDFDQLARGVAMMDRNLSPFANSGSQATKALKELGISATDAQGKMRPASDVLADIAEKFAGMKDGSEKTAVAMAIFSRAGMGMIPILNKGGEAIREATTEAKKYHVVMDEATAERMADYLEAMRSLKAAFEGFAMTVGEKVVPLMTVGFKHASDVMAAGLSEIQKGMQFVSDHSQTLIHVTEALSAAMLVYVARTAATAAAQLAMNAAVQGGWVLQNLGFIVQYYASSVGAATIALRGFIATEVVATAGLVAVVAAVTKAIDAWRQAGEAIKGAQAAAAEQARTARIAEESEARFLLAFQRVTGHMAQGATEQQRFANAQREFSRLTAAQQTAIEKLVSAKKKDADATAKNTAAVQTASDAQIKLREARQNTAVLFDKIAEEVKEADKKAADDAVTTADNIRMSWYGLDGSVNQSAQGMIESILGVPAKIEPAFKDLQAQIDTTVKSLNQMAAESTQSTLSAGARIRQDYQQRIQSIQQLVRQEQILLNQHRITEAQMVQVTQAASAAQNAARQQEMAEMRQLQQQQAQQTLSTVDSFMEMGLAAAGYRGVVVRALMDVIKTLQQEAIAHLTSAAGTTAAENIKSAAVGKGIGLRAVWHGMEQVALAIADLASFNFAGAAQHFKAAGSFGSVAAAVGTAVASLFSGAGSSSGAGAASAASASRSSSTSTAASGATPTAAAAPAPIVNVKIDGVISADNLTTVMQKISAAVSNGSGTLTASHINVNGAVMPAGALA